MKIRVLSSVLTICGVLSVALLAGCGGGGNDGAPGVSAPMATITGTVIDPITGDPADPGTVAAIGFNVITRALEKDRQIYRATGTRATGEFTIQVPTGTYAVVSCVGDELMFDSDAGMEPVSALTAGETYTLQQPLTTLYVATRDASGFSAPAATDGTNCKVLAPGGSASWTFTLPYNLTSTSVDTIAVHRFFWGGTGSDPTYSVSGAYLTNAGVAGALGSNPYDSSSTYSVSNPTTYPAGSIFYVRNVDLMVNNNLAGSIFDSPAGDANLKHIQLSVATDTSGTNNLLIRSDLINVYQVKAGDDIDSLYEASFFGK